MQDYVFWMRWSVWRILMGYVGIRMTGTDVQPLRG